jgi:hypothetical protein
MRNEFAPGKSGLNSRIQRWRALSAEPLKNVHFECLRTATDERPAMHLRLFQLRNRCNLEMEHPCESL